MKWFRSQSQMPGPPTATSPAVASGSGTAASGHINGHAHGSADVMGGEASAPMGQVPGDFHSTYAHPSYQYPMVVGSNQLSYGNPHHAGNGGGRGYPVNSPHRNPLAYPTSSHSYPRGDFLAAEEDREFQAALSESKREYESSRSRNSSELDDRELNDFKYMNIHDGAGREQGISDRLPNSASRSYRLSLRFCTINAIGYDENLVDGFYCITFGMEHFPHCVGKSNLPSLEKLREEEPKDASDLREVIEVNRSNDGGKLCRLEEKAIDTVLEHAEKEAAKAWLLGQLVVRRLGGGTGKDIKNYEGLVQRCSSRLRMEQKSVVIPLGSLEQGLARHRALLFKALADAVGVPCRLVRAVRFGGKDYTISVVVKLYQMEYYVDLMSDPCTFLPESDEDHTPEQSATAERVQSELEEVSTMDESGSHWLKQHGSYEAVDKRISEEKKRYDDFPIPNKEAEETVEEIEKINQEKFQSAGKNASTDNFDNKIHDINSLIESGKMEIKWEDIAIKTEKVGRGSFGEVYRGVYCDTEVAVKVLLDQDMNKEAYLEFCSEVAIMQRLRHPNIVLFMGAVIEPGHLSIVTEFLHRGSLYKILQNHTDLPFAKRLRLAHDVVKGMCYLHGCKPPIVHRDLKSPNLLVDRNWLVKVSDFGLSRVKSQTFISGKTAAGTAEWTAPEVLKNEPSDEHADVFSFGVVLWELLTLKQPWEGMTSMQVVVAVCFQSQRLPIDKITDPELQNILTQCWDEEPKARPSFSDLKERLGKLIRSIQVASQKGKEKITSVQPEKNSR